MLIYVAGPLSAETRNETNANVRRAVLAGMAVIERGHTPFVPHLSQLFDDLVFRARGYRLDAETYMQWDFVILRRCDGLLYLGESPGANRELALARELGLPVWTSADEVPKA